MTKQPGKIFTVLLIIFAVEMLSGCNVTKPSMPKTPPTVIQETKKPAPTQEARRLTQCQKELDVLKDLNPNQHHPLRQTFDRLMNRAAQYGGLRAQVNGDTQRTIDALYQYKVNRLCADISHMAFIELSEYGEQLR